MVYSSARCIGVDESMRLVRVLPGSVWFWCQRQRVCGFLFPAVPTLLRLCLHFSVDFLSDPRASWHSDLGCQHPPFMNPGWSWLGPSDDALTCRSVCCPLLNKSAHPSSWDYSISPLSCLLSGLVCVGTCSPGSLPQGFCT